MENKVIENEKKVNVEETKNVEVKAQEKKLFVERESFVGSDGENYWAYVVKGKVRTREVKVDFIPKDKGGYEPLDIVFEVSPKAELIMTNEEVTDSNGNKTKYVAYAVRTVDEEGMALECEVKPKQPSDKALLKMLITQLNFGGSK